MAKHGYIDYIALQGVTIPLTVLPAPVGGVANRRQNIARVRTAEPRSWRVLLQPWVIASDSPQNFVTSDANFTNKPTAHVTFGADGVTQDAEVDWHVNGGMFSCWGDSVTVDAGVPAQWGFVAPATFANVVCGGSIAPLATSGSVRPTKTLTTGLVAPAATTGAIAVPRFARALRWHSISTTNGANAPAAISWLFLLGTPIGQIPQVTPSGVYTTTELVQNDGITFGPDVRFVRMANNSADSIRVAMEFVLDLG